MSKFLVVFDECGGPETYLENSLESALERIATIQIETYEDAKTIADSVEVYEVVASYAFVPPQGEGALVYKDRF